MLIEAPRRRRRPLIGLTPLIDVVFILLIFFMLASSFQQWRSISLGIPGEGGAPAPESDTLVVRLLSDGRVQLDGETLGLDALEARMRSMYASDPERAMVIRTEADVALQRVVGVVERLNGVGVRHISLDRGVR